MKSPNDHTIELGRNQVHGQYGFHRNNENFINFLVTLPTVRKTLTWAYSALVGTKKMLSIEKLPDEEKHKLWEMTKFYADGRLKGDNLKELSKALIALEYYLQ